MQRNTITVQFLSPDGHLCPRNHTPNTADRTLSTRRCWHSIASPKHGTAIITVQQPNGKQQIIEANPK